MILIPNYLTVKQSAFTLHFAAQLVTIARETLLQSLQLLQKYGQFCCKLHVRGTIFARLSVDSDRTQSMMYTLHVLWYVNQAAQSNV